MSCTPHPSVLFPISDCVNPFYSYQQHANYHALNEYNLEGEKKAARGEGTGFDGELNNFQAPQLSSLSKLVSILFCLVPAIP